MRYATTAFRLYVSASVLITCNISLNVPKSLVSQAVWNGEPLGVFFLSLSTILAAIGLVDTIVNDCWFIPFNSKHTLRWRQLGYMVLSVFSASTAFVILSSNGYHPVILRYLIDSVAAAAVAVLGLRDLYNGPRLSPA